MIINRENIEINYTSPVLAIVHSNIRENSIYCLCKDYFLIKINTHTQEVNPIAQLALDKIDIDEPLFLHLSLMDTLIAIVNSHGQYGYVYDLEIKEIVLILDRKDYQISHTNFPIHFLKIKDQDYLIHATDWNHLDIFDFTLKKNITDRNTNEYGKDQYLDYFYSQLSVSPTHKWLLSSGWVWHPVSVVKFIDLDKWMNGSISEAEKLSEADFSIMSYYWDRALCWVDENSIAYLYDPREEGLDEEERAEEGFETDTGYLLVYDASQGKIKQKIKFSEFSQNEYFEATPDCRVYFMSFIFISSKKKGLFILDKDSGEIILKDENLVLDQYNERNDVFYKLIENQSIELVKIS